MENSIHEMDVISTVLLVVVGLIIFLYAVGRMSDALKRIGSDRLEFYLSKYTENIISSVLVGTVVTTLLDSSSAVIILAIVLTNSGVMRFRNTIGVVMGANIGTTFGSQIIAFDIGEWSAVPLVVGLMMRQLGKTAQLRNVGDVVFGIGLLFAGLFIMGYAVEPLQDSPSFVNWLKELESPLRGALVGGLLTLIIQSSSATVAMAITLGAKGLLTLPAGIAVMLGAELGTCSTSLLATLRTNRAALKVGVFHVGFNLITIVFGLLLIDPFTDLVIWISQGAEVSRSVANAHVLFNSVGVLLFLPFVGWIADFLERIIPDKKDARPETLVE